MTSSRIIPKRATKKRYRRTEERNLKLMGRYEELIKDINNNHSEYAGGISAGQKYTILADEFLISKQTVGSIVCKYLKNGGYKGNIPGIHPGE